MPAGDRFDDRRMRGGRINERGGGRGNPMGVRGGYSDIRPGRRQRCRDYDGMFLAFLFFTLQHSTLNHTYTFLVTRKGLLHAW